jgi:transposase
MRKSKDKKFLRLQLVLSVEQYGIKQTARNFKTTRNTVRKWYRRWLQEHYKGLEELSRRPHTSPYALSQTARNNLVALKKKYKRIGADTIKSIENLPYSSKTIRKIWRQEGVSSRKRRKKYITKRNLREVKKKFALFQHIIEDTKDLIDIPEYWIQLQQKPLPKVQYTSRDVTSGLMFLGFADEKSLTYSTLFAEYLNYHLQHLGADLSKTVRQTDNGAEYIGSWQAKKPSAYTLAIEEVNGQTHYTIFPGAHRMQADVETVHNLIEAEFYEIENFKSRRDFMNKVYSYQLFFNLVRTNSYKENKTPWQIAQEKSPHSSIEIAKIPPVDLCSLLKRKIDFLSKRGYDVSSVPFFLCVSLLQSLSNPSINPF